MSEIKPAAGLKRPDAVLAMVPTLSPRRHRSDDVAAVKEAAAQLDGSDLTAVAQLTGLDGSELEDLGGVPKEAPKRGRGRPAKIAQAGSVKWRNLGVSLPFSVAVAYRAAASEPDATMTSVLGAAFEAAGAELGSGKTGAVGALIEGERGSKGQGILSTGRVRKEQTTAVNLRVLAAGYEAIDDVRDKVEAASRSELVTAVLRAYLNKRTSVAGESRG